jgi:Polyphosphate kinase 2 (PPK2)
MSSSPVWGSRTSTGSSAESTSANDAIGTTGSALGRCSTAAAPWHVVPANRNWYRNWAVSQFLVETMEDMKLIYPNSHLDVRALKKSLQAAA